MEKIPFSFSMTPNIVSFILTRLQIEFYNNCPVGTKTGLFIKDCCKR